ncbi:hypothetical protein [Lederbergia lenta]|uniref:Uncharacterized protein n=1 Tax=Lederbergia lenta TaxID=1467 RepID=A0A2X4W1M1_LEDLE|nr:hypothetical protein [Lederbergia lenta]MCM3109364.1 hypothetical protein [Lederbergia lenta]MEC2324871.1 hypothetical protein [Lederbergia lenta]SQI57011.1 Uncharacterised protein [Lederbergia lenta]
MNIKDYYSRMTRLYMNQTVLFSLVFITIILPSIKQVDFLHVNLAGIVVSLCLFNFFLKYVYFSGKNREVSTLISSKDFTMSKAQSYILLRSPSSFSYFDIYSADGICRFSISMVKGKEKRSRNKLSETTKAKLMFRLEQQGSANISYIHVNSNDAVIFIQDNKIPLIITQINSREKEILIGSKTYHLKRQYADYILSTDEKVLMRIKKGFMPIKMQALFQPNTPVLSFESRLTEDQKYLCLCLLVYL